MRWNGEKMFDKLDSGDDDILWNYVCAGNNGVITGFTYESGTPP